MDIEIRGIDPNRDAFVVPSAEGGALLVDLDERTLVDVLELDSHIVGTMGLRIAVKEIRLKSVNPLEYRSIENKNRYVMKRLVRPTPDLGSYLVDGEIPLNLGGNTEPTYVNVGKFQEVEPVYPPVNPAA